MKPQIKKEIKKKKTKDKIDIKIRKRYTEETIREALDAIKNGMAKKQAAKQYQVPRSTLQFRIKKPDHKPQPGPSPVLNIEEENKLKNWLNVSHRKGFPKRKEDLLRSVSEFIEKSGRPNPFKDNIPGEKWFKLFLKRHPDISVRTPEAVTAASAAVSVDDIKGWFQTIEKYLKEQGLLEILSDPKRVLNGDETNFVLCAKTGVVLAPKGAKNVYEVDHAPAKTSLTVMFTFAANGETTPPMVIFPYKRLPSEIASKMPSDWGIGLSENGWMKTEIFSQYIEKVLHPHLVRNQVRFPVILFVDGHKTHLTYAVSELCSSLDIVLVALYPNCTRLLQPADVSAFRPLKGGWQKTVLEWRRDNPARALTKIDFVPLLQKTIEKCVKPDTIINGFRTTGLYPWNPNAIDYSKCLGKNLNSETENKKQPECERVMKKQDFINIVGKTMIKDLTNKQNMTVTETILKKLCEFFNANEEEEDNIEMTNRKDGHGNTQLYKKITPASLNDQELLDIANMDIVMCDENDTASNIPLAQEVLIEEIVNFDREEITAANEFEMASFLKNTENTGYISEDDTQTIDCIQVSHAVQIETYKEGTDSRIDHNPNKEISKPVIHQPEPGLNKIAISTMESNPIVTTSVKTNLHKIQLDDILVLPKTPQRKGVRNTKKTSFVITSEEFKEEERRKINEKKAKEEGIQKRKEERQQKMLIKAKQRDNKENEKIKNKENFKIPIEKIKQNLNYTCTKIKKEKCDMRNKNKNKREMVQIMPKKVLNKPKKKDTKCVLKNILHSEEALSNTDEDEKSDSRD